MAIKDLGYMVDCSRGRVPRINELKKLVDILSKFHYTYLMLYTEDIYEMENHPYFGYMRGAYSLKELQELDQYASTKGIELRACIQTLAHLERLKRHKTYQPLFDDKAVLLVKDEGVYKLIDDMFKTMSNAIKSKRIHIGMDEAWGLGRGKYLELYGKENTNSIMTYHLKRVAEIAKKYGYTCYIWGDMLRTAYNEDKTNYKIDIPDNVIPFIWRYCTIGKKKTEEEIKLYQKLSSTSLAFASGAYSWIGFAPNNQYSFESLEEQIYGCNKYGIDEYLVTAWGDGASETSLFATLPSLFFASIRARGLKLNKETKKEFKDIIGISFDDFLEVDTLNRIKKDKKLYKNHNNNLHFSHLYNDTLQDLFPTINRSEYKKLYLSAARKLKRLSKNKEYGYIFNNLSSLATLLSHKCDLSKNIYETYKNKGDFEPVILQLKLTLKSLEKFMEIHEYQWLKEAKAFGYEKQNIRLGGLKERLLFTIRLLTRYKNGEISSIDELEVEHIGSNYYNHEIDPDIDIINEYIKLVSGGSLIDF